jgi:hypothetical protein
MNSYFKKSEQYIQHEYDLGRLLKIPAVGGRDIKNASYYNSFI